MPISRLKKAARLLLNVPPSLLPEGRGRSGLIRSSCRASAFAVLLCISWMMASTPETTLASATATESTSGATSLSVPPSGGDDTAALQKAIDSLPAYKAGIGGGIIQLLPATYTLSGTIRLKSGIELRGAGRRRTLITGKVDAPFFDTASDGTNKELTLWFGMSDLFIRNLSTNQAARCLQFNQSAQFVGERLCMFSTGGYHAEIVGGNLMTFRSVQFGGGKGADACVYLNGTSAAGGVNVVRFESCDFQDAKSGLRAISGTALMIHGCHFEHLEGGLARYDDSVIIDGWQGGAIVGNYFDTCHQLNIGFGNSQSKPSAFTVGANYHYNTSAKYFVAIDALSNSTILPNHFNPGPLNKNASGVYVNTPDTGNVIHPQSLASGTGTAISGAAGRGGTILEAEGAMSSSSVSAMNGKLTIPTVAIPESTIDWSLSSSFSKTLGGNTRFSFSSAVDGQTIAIAVTNTAENWTVTWPETVKWINGIAPKQTIGAHTDIYRFANFDGTIYGSVTQNY